MLFWVEECAILYGTFYGPCKADFSPEKDRDGIDSHKSRLGLQPDAPTKGISPVMLIEWYSTTSQLPFHKNTQPYMKCLSAYAMNMSYALRKN